MQNLISDLLQNIQNYYDGFVALLPKIGMAVIVLLLFMLLAGHLRRFTLRRLNKKMDDPLLAKFISRLTGTIILIVALLIVLNIVGLGGIAVGLLSTAGVGAFVIGFAFKDIGENFLAGIVMAFQRPFRVGDVVELTGLKGKVVTLNLRDTQIKTFDGKDIYIPNGVVIKNPVINFTIDGFLRHDFTIGLDYSSDISHAMKIVLDTVNTVEGVLGGDKKPFIAVNDLGASTLNLKVHFWIDTFDENVSAVSLKIEAVEKTLKALDKAGYYMPSDILEIKSYKDEQLPVSTFNNEGQTTLN